MTCDGHRPRGNHAEELHKNMDRIGVFSWAKFYLEVFASRRQHQSIEKTSQNGAVRVSLRLSSTRLCASGHTAGWSIAGKYWLRNDCAIRARGTERRVPPAKETGYTDVSYSPILNRSKDIYSVLSGNKEGTGFRIQQAGGSACLRTRPASMIKASSSQRSRSTREMAIVLLVGTDLRGRSAVHDQSFPERRPCFLLVPCEQTKRCISGEGRLNRLCMSSTMTA